MLFLPPFDTAFGKDRDRPNILSGVAVFSFL